MRRVSVANSNATSVMPFIGVNFFLVFQPIFNLQNKKIAGCEALLRWRHPNLGVRLPNEFMNAMEETGLITDVGEWVLGQACKAAATWPGNMRVAVNISAVQLQTAKLLSSVVNALNVSTLPARQLEIEITETAVIDDSNQVPKSRHFARRKNSETILGAPQVTASFTGLLDRTALERRLFCDPSSSIEYDAVTNPYCPRRSDNGVYPSAWVLAKITDLLPIVSNECPKNIRILG